MKKQIFVAFIILGAFALPVFADELKDAYTWSYSKQITTLKYEQADLYGNVSRQAMAKMIVNFYKNALKKTTKSNQNCNFLDLNKAAPDLVPYIKESCQLGIMGQDTQYFNPTGNLTRAQFGTLLSRTVWGSLYDGKNPYYKAHLNALASFGIMNDISKPDALEKRGYVMLMMKRAFDILKLDPDNDYAAQYREQKKAEQEELLDKFEQMKANSDTYEASTLNVTKADGQKIVGTIYRPNKSGKLPLLIISHGLSQTRSAIWTYAEYFAGKGMAVYTFDYIGGSSKSESGGSTTTMSVKTEMQDLKDVIAAAEKREFVDTNNIVLMGISQGGLVSALVSAELGSKIKGAILFYPAFSVQEIVKNLYSNLSDVPATFNFLGQITLGKKYAEDIWDFDVYEAIKKDNKKILIVHGDADGIIKLSASEKAAKTYSNAEMHVLKGATHGFSGNYFLDAIDFATKYLKGLGIIKD